MKTVKRIFAILTALVCLIIVAEGIHLSTLGKTVDCAGTVTSVDTDNKTIRITDDFNVEYLLQVKLYTSVKNLDGKRISIEKIESGDVITANFLGKWKDKDTPLSATTIKAAS